MADLTLCYFCGRGPDDAIGEYAVVPPVLDPSPEQQQSVALCPDCREKLMAVMDPVVDAAESFASGSATAAGAGSGPSGADGEVGRSPGSDATAGGDARGERLDSDDDGTGSGPPRVAGGDTSSVPDETSDAAGDSADDAPGSTGDGDVDGDADSASASSTETTGASDEDVVEPEDIMARNEGGVGGGESPSDSEAPRDQPHADDELVGRNNEAYNKTLRLLQNREFPVERHDIEQVAANAYQLDPQEVSDAIDALIRKGLLTQEGAQLVRP